VRDIHQVDALNKPVKDIWPAKVNRVFRSGNGGNAIMANDNGAMTGNFGTIDEETEKKRRSLKPLARLFPYLKRYKFHVGAALFFLLLAAATTLTLPLAVRRMVDHGFSGGDTLFIDNYFSMLVIIAGVLAIASSCRYYFVIWLGERVVSDIRSDVFAHVTKLSADFFDTAQTGEIISRLTADTTQIKSAVGATTSMALRNTLLGIGALIMMVYSAPGLSLIVIGALPVIVLPIIAFGRAVRRRSRVAQDTLAQATAYATESISAVRTMQAFSNEEMVQNRFSQAVENAFEAARLAIRTRALLTAMAIFLIFSSVVAVLWFGAQDVLAGKMTPGALGQFLLYAVFAAGALAALSEVWGELSLAAGAAERIAELLLEEPGIRAPEHPKKLATPLLGEIAFENVDFAYPTRLDLPILNGFSQSIKPGETIALVGSSGAGKSTLFSLLLRFYDPESGRVTVDGNDIRDLDPSELRKSIAFVPQETMIFAASAFENIAYGDPGASRDAVIAAAKAANAHEFIERLSNGYETPLGERGIKIGRAHV